MARVLPPSSPGFDSNGDPLPPGFDNYAASVENDNDGNIMSVTSTGPHGTYKMTFTWTAGELTAWSAWVKQ